MQSGKEKLKNTTIGLMVGVALFFDALGALLNLIFMYWVVTIVAYPTFWLWFHFKGIKLLTPKRLSIQGGTLLAELIPLFSALPAITAMVALTVMSTKAKEVKEGKKDEEGKGDENKGEKEGGEGGVGKKKK